MRQWQREEAIQLCAIDHEYPDVQQHISRQHLDGQPETLSAGQTGQPIGQYATAPLPQPGDGIEGCVGVHSTTSTVLDRQNAIYRLGGNAEMYDKFLAMFLSELDAHEDRIIAAAERDDAHVLTIEAHGLRGASATIGADRICDAARALESLALSGDPDERTVRLERLRIEIADLKQFVKDSKSR
jgi:HPt (histidine-containing phosphotransfer) domain-containing protein